MTKNNKKIIRVERDESDMAEHFKSVGTRLSIIASGLLGLASIFILLGYAIEWWFPDGGTPVKQIEKEDTRDESVE